MKRILLPLALVIVLVLLTATVASADTPPGVAPAIRMGFGMCEILFFDPEDTRYVGDAVKVFSNGATGHSTYKCKFELVSGTPKYLYDEYEFVGCYRTVSIEGQKGMFTEQCFGEWYP